MPPHVDQTLDHRLEDIVGRLNDEINQVGSFWNSLAEIIFYIV